MLKNFSKFISLNKNIRIIYLSATSVYGDHKGRWVNEKSKLKPSTIFGKRRKKAEKNWLKFQRENKNNIIIFRLPGIYSKENNALKRLRYSNKVIIDKKKTFFFKNKSRRYR